MKLVRPFTAQVKYSAFDRELLACYRHFRYMVEGRKFTIYTDHKPLTFALRRTTDPWTARQCRQLAFVAKYTSDLRHLAGKDNVIADALSRPPGHAVGESPPAAAGVKAPPGLPVAARQGDKPISSTSAAVMAVAAADHAPQAGVDYYKMAAEQQRCEESLQLAASPSLQVQWRQVRGWSCYVTYPQQWCGPSYRRHAEEKFSQQYIIRPTSSARYGAVSRRVCEALCSTAC
jgi:hypothetical protein